MDVYSARMHCACNFLCAPSDQEYVEGYRVQVVSSPNTESCKEILGDNHTIQKDIAFDSKVCMYISIALLVGLLEGYIV